MIRIVGAKDIGAMLQRKAARMTHAEDTVRPILDAVRKRGDTALLEYAQRFDALERRTVIVPVEELQIARRELSPQFRSALRLASKNIRAFAKMQLPLAWMRVVATGLRVGQIVRPLETVAAYIPAGRYPLPSTLLMTVIPAQVAGVPNVCVASPRRNNEIYGTAGFLKLSKVFQMGGAHAIAAFAYGTATVPRADRIVGPGNVYVAAAKKLLAGEVGIDFIAGPTEIVIIAEEGNPAWIAADMLAQAEHDEEASALLFTTSKRLANSVRREIERQLVHLSTAGVARKAIDSNSAIILFGSLQQAIEASNRFAPEHLSIPDTSMLPAIRHAGSVFLGPMSPEAAGDYASGPNHVLPTSGFARLRGGLSAADYVKLISVQELNGRALARLTPAIVTLARAEGLEAHARSVEVRRNA